MPLQPPVTSLSAIRIALGKNGVPDDRPEVVSAYEAAEAWVGKRTRWAGTDPTSVPAPPADLVKAVELLTRRYLARLSSPDGLVGMGEFGVGRLPAVDFDVRSLIGPYRRVVFG